MTEIAASDFRHPRRHVRLDTILRLRWLAVLGQLAAIFVVAQGLEFDVEVIPCVAIVSLSALLNLVLQIAFNPMQRLEPAYAAALLALHANTEPQQLEVPVAWLLAIARNKLFESYRRGKVEAAAREKLGLEPLLLDDSDLALVDELSETDLVNQLADLLPPDQLQALRARVIDEREYDDIARDLHCSEAVVRKRVSRALSTLRARVNSTS